MIRINLTEINYNNYNTIIYQDFYIFAFTYIRGITTTLGNLFTDEKSEFSIIFNKVFIFFTSTYKTRVERL